jgi:hypothetical protein
VTHRPILGTFLIPPAFTVVGEFQFSPRAWIGAALLTAYYWAQYLHAIAVAPHPGTFWSKYHDELYLIQCVEGVLNLAVFASAAVFIAAASRLRGGTSLDHRAMNPVSTVLACRVTVNPCEYTTRFATTCNTARVH